MADYPSLAQWEGTRLIPRAGVMERIASNGAYRPRALQSGIKYDIVVVHAFMSSADRTTLLTFYNSNRVYSFNFLLTEDGVTRTCYFAGNPFEIEPIAGMTALYKATVHLREA